MSGTRAQALVVDAVEIVDIAAAIADSGTMMMDTEFASDGRYIPELALFQVAWGDPSAPQVRLIDFPAVGASGMAPLFELVARDDIDTVAHSAHQDLSLLITRFQVQARGFWDTQIAAAFAGEGEQIGYGKLVRRLLGVHLDKSSQFTDWLERPLSDKQLQYASADVRFLASVWAALRAKLEDRGRISWVRDESRRLAESVKPPAAPDDAYREVKGWRGLREKQLASLRALAGWRQRIALDRNLPLSWILPDRVMIDLCKGRARNERALRAVRGVGDGTVRRYGSQILHHIARGVSGEISSVPPSDIDKPKTKLTPRASLWAAIIMGMVTARCIQEQIAPRFVSNRADAERVAVWFDTGAQHDPPEVALLVGWRRELVGDDVLRWLRGQSTLVCDTGPSGLRLDDWVERIGDVVEPGANT